MQQMARMAGQPSADQVYALMGASIPDRVDRLVQADYRRLEVDAFNAWVLNTSIQRNPETGATFTASYGFSATRYVTAGTAWTDGGVNAYDLLQTFITNAENLCGPVEGAMCRLALYNAILADAPNQPNAVKMTRSMLDERISEDLGKPFRLVVNEQSVDVFVDGGLAWTRTKVFPVSRIAAIPDGGKVGFTAFAPVLRAMEMASQVGPDAGIDVRGVTVYYDENNTGRDLQIEAQLNALPVPNEQLIYVENTLVT
jgi:hypothetical protein